MWYLLLGPIDAYFSSLVVLKFKLLSVTDTSDILLLIIVINLITILVRRVSFYF